MGGSQGRVRERWAPRHQAWFHFPPEACVWLGGSLDWLSGLTSHRGQEPGQDGHGELHHTLQH